MHKIFRYPIIPETFKGGPRNFFALWDPNFPNEKRDTPNMHKIFRYFKFSETFKGGPRNFLALWDPYFSTEYVIPPLFIHKTFQNQKLSQKQWDSLTKVFGSVRYKNFDWKSWYATSYPYIFFDTRNLLENRRVPLQNFSFRSCGTKKSTKSCVAPLLCKKIFDKRSFLKHQNVVQWNILL